MVILRRDLLQRLHNACKREKYPTEADSNALQKLEDMINGLNLNLLDSCRCLRSAKMRTFLKTYIHESDRILDNDKFQMKKRAINMLKQTNRIIMSAQIPLTFANTSDIPTCQTKEDIQLGCKIASIIIGKLYDFSIFIQI